MSPLPLTAQYQQGDQFHDAPQLPPQHHLILPQPQLSNGQSWTDTTIPLKIPGTYVTNLRLREVERLAQSHKL